MTQRSIGEYTEAIRERYLRVPRKEKGKILDEFTMSWQWESSQPGLMSDIKGGHWLASSVQG